MSGSADTLFVHILCSHDDCPWKVSVSVEDASLVDMTDDEVAAWMLAQLLRHLAEVHGEQYG